jgi:hypothetical protein
MTYLSQVIFTQSSGSLIDGVVASQALFWCCLSLTVLLASCWRLERDSLAGTCVFCCLLKHRAPNCVSSVLTLSCVSLSNRVVLALAGYSSVFWVSILVALVLEIAAWSRWVNCFISDCGQLRVWASRDSRSTRMYHL